MTRSKLALLAVLFILVLWLFKPKAPSSRAPIAAAGASTKTLSSKPAPAPKLPKTIVTGSPQAALAEDQIGLKRGSYVLLPGGRRTLEILVEARASCHTGDLDIIKSAIPEGQPLLVSLEAMPSGTAITQSVAFARLLRGVQIRLPVRNRGISLYGLFICSDQSRSGHCRGKPPANMSGLAAPATARSSADQIFYFQPVLLDQQKFMHFQGTGSALQSLQSYLDARTNSKASASIDEAIKLSTALGSLPVNSTDKRDHNGSSLHVMLPYLQMQRCAKHQVTAPL